MKKQTRIRATPLTKEEKEIVYKMFFGPYKKSWYHEDGNVDNRTGTIAKRLNTSYSVVSEYIKHELNLIVKKINSKK